MSAGAVRDIVNLNSITLWEQTTSIFSHTFGVNSSELATRLANPLGGGNWDFRGTSIEFYDVFYSNAAGAFDIDGEYVTIEAAYEFPPHGGAMNIAEVQLNFADTSTEFANVAASFASFGNSAIPASVANAIDGDINTATALGSTVGPTERLRLTLGFASSSGPITAAVPEPSTLFLLIFGLALCRLRSINR